MVHMIKIKTILYSIWIIPAVMFVFTSCEKQNSTRRYTEIETVQSRSNSPEIPQTELQSLPEHLIERSSEDLLWTTPKGWVEEKGSGMRLATLFVNTGNKTAECSIVKLAGNAGGLKSNVTRWMKQLEFIVPDDNKMNEYLAEQIKFKAGKVHDGVFIDMTELLSGNMMSDKSGLFAIIEVEGSTVFLKFTGSKALLLKNRDTFLELCKSIHTAEIS